jgi:hypothetical protein
MTQVLTDGLLKTEEGSTGLAARKQAPGNQLPLLHDVTCQA